MYYNKDEFVETASGNKVDSSIHITDIKNCER